MYISNDMLQEELNKLLGDDKDFTILPQRPGKPLVIQFTNQEKLNLLRTKIGHSDHYHVDPREPKEVKVQKGKIKAFHASIQRANQINTHSVSREPAAVTSSSSVPSSTAPSLDQTQLSTVSQGAVTLQNDARVISYGPQPSCLKNTTNFKALQLGIQLNDVQKRNRVELFDECHTSQETNPQEIAYQPNVSSTPWSLYYDHEPKVLKQPTNIQKALAGMYGDLLQAYIRTTQSAWWVNKYPECKQLKALGKERIAYADNVLVKLTDQGDKLPTPISVAVTVGCAPNLMVNKGTPSSHDDWTMFKDNPEFYFEEITKQIYRTLCIHASGGTQVLVTPLIGAGLFLNGLSSDEKVKRQNFIARAFVKASLNLRTAFPQNSLKEIILAVPDPQLFAIVNEVFRVSTNLPITLTLTNAGTIATVQQIQNTKCKVGVNVAGHDCDIGGGYFTIAHSAQPGPAEENFFAATTAASVFLGSPPRNCITFSALNSLLLVAECATTAACVLENNSADVPASTPLQARSTGPLLNEKQLNFDDHVPNCTLVSNSSKKTVVFPNSYYRIWNDGEGKNDIEKIKALLKDYTKEDSGFGSFLGRVFTAHWNRHHVDRVSVIANTKYNEADALINALKSINPTKDGSLDRRIQFIEGQIYSEKPSLNVGAQRQP